MTEYMIANLPSPPSPAAITVVAGQLRNIAAGLAGMGLLTGLTISDDKLTAISAMLLTVGSGALWAGMGIWSAYQKWKAKRLDHADSVASAVASARETMARGTPAPVVVTAPPPPS